MYYSPLINQAEDFYTQQLQLKKPSLKGNTSDNLETDNKMIKLFDQIQKMKEINNVVVAKLDHLLKSSPDTFEYKDYFRIMEVIYHSKM